MSTINLKDFYPSYKEDCYIDVSDEVAEALLAAERKEATSRRRLYRYRAQYSLDRGDGIESCHCLTVLSPGEIHEQKNIKAQLYSALVDLPSKQARRIYAHYFLGMSKLAIARAEGVNESKVRVSIERGLRNMEKDLKKFL